MRINLGEGSELRTIKDLERYALANMNRSHMEFKELAEEEGFTTRERTVGKLVALEIVHEGDADADAGPVPARRGLTVLGGDFLLVIAMLHLNGGDADTSVQWDHMVASLHVEPTGWTLGKTVTLIAIALGIFVLVLFSSRMYIGRRESQNPWAVRTGSDVSTMSKEGWGRDGAVPSLPSSPGPGASLPSPQSRSSVPTPATARTLPSSPPRTLPASPPRTAPAAEARTVPISSARTLPSSPPRTAPAAAARTVPASSARTLPSSPPRTLPASPLGADAAAPAVDAAPPEPKPRGEGLSSTVPPTGRWSPSA